MDTPIAHPLHWSQMNGATGAERGDPHDLRHSGPHDLRDPPLLQQGVPESGARGHVWAANPHGGKAVTFVGSIRSSHGTAPCKPLRMRGTLIGKRVGAVAEKRCGARCMSSTGPSWECSCGGHNHGNNHG